MGRKESESRETTELDRHSSSSAGSSWMSPLLLALLFIGITLPGAWGQGGWFAKGEEVDPCAVGAHIGRLSACLKPDGCRALEAWEEAFGPGGLGLGQGRSGADSGPTIRVPIPREVLKSSGVALTVPGTFLIAQGATQEEGQQGGQGEGQQEDNETETQADEEETSPEPRAKLRQEVSPYSRRSGPPLFRPCLAGPG